MAVGVGGWCALSVSLSNVCKEDSQFAPDWYRWHALPTELLIYYSETLLKLQTSSAKKRVPGWMFRLGFKNGCQNQLFSGEDDPLPCRRVSVSNTSGAARPLCIVAGQPAAMLSSLPQRVTWGEAMC